MFFLLIKNYLKNFISNFQDARLMGKTSFFNSTYKYSSIPFDVGTIYTTHNIQSKTLYVCEKKNDIQNYVLYIFTYKIILNIKHYAEI